MYNPPLIIYFFNMYAGGDSVVAPSTTMGDDVGLDMGSSPPTEVCHADPGGCSTEAPGSPTDEVLSVLLRTPGCTMK